MKNMNFAVIDFETANSSKDSMCEVGVTVVRNGVIESTYGNLIVPPTGMFSFENTPIHGITPEMVHLQGRLWNEVEPLIRRVIGDLPLVAHNVGFDRSVYLSTSESVGLPAQAEFEWIDSVLIARKFIGKGALADACAHYRIPMESHHRATDDAESAAKMILAIAKEFGIDDIRKMSGAVDGETTKKRRNPSMSKEQYLAHQKRKYKKSADLPEPNLNADPDHPLFGQRIAVTGEIPGMSDDEVFEKVAYLGGKPSWSVTMDTNILIVAEGAGETKQQRAREVQEKGKPLKVITWKDFLARVSDGAGTNKARRGSEEL